MFTNWYPTSNQLKFICSFSRIVQVILFLECIKKILLIAFRYKCHGSSMNRLTLSTLYAISDLVHVRYGRLLTKLRYSQSLISRSRKYFINPKFVISNLRFITYLNSSAIFSLLPMKIRSST